MNFKDSLKLLFLSSQLVDKSCGEFWPGSVSLEIRLGLTVSGSAIRGGEDGSDILSERISTELRPCIADHLRIAFIEEKLKINWEKFKKQFF